MTTPHPKIRPPGVPKPKPPPPVQWELTYAVWGGHEVFLHLTEGWEPMGVTALPELDGSGSPVIYIWFRRQVRA